jgi:hypothetical protein
MKALASVLMVSAMLACGSARAQTSDTGSGVVIDVASAQAVLAAVGNPQLAPDEALRIARLGGNQGLVRKENSYGRPAKTSDLADALLAVAHGRSESGAFQFNFAAVKTNSPRLTALLNRIQSHPTEFHDWVIQRVTSFSPPDARLAITGYLIVGGASGGFAFDDPKFYLNLNYDDFSDYDAARVVMAHELYHAVQATYADTTKPWYVKTQPKDSPDPGLAQQCSDTADLFDALYQEGSASYVGDVVLLDGIDTPKAKALVADFTGGLKELHKDVTLLELSVTGLDAPQPVAFKDIYSLGFYVPEPLYKVGYVMAKAIDHEAGRPALIGMLSKPGYRFADAYLQLPSYGKDYEHPKLGVNTVAAIHRLIAGCPRTPTAAKP